MFKKTMKIYPSVFFSLNEIKRLYIVKSNFHFLSWLTLNVANVIFTTFDLDKMLLFSNIEHLYIMYAVSFSQYDFGCEQPNSLWVHEQEL